MCRRVRLTVGLGRFEINILQRKALISAQTLTSYRDALKEPGIVLEAVFEPVILEADPMSTPAGLRGE
jgi:hypothetical protein